MFLLVYHRLILQARKEKSEKDKDKISVLLAGK
jgi:hypothetical protein